MAAVSSSRAINPRTLDDHKSQCVEVQIWSGIQSVTFSFALSTTILTVKEKICQSANFGFYLPASSQTLSADGIQLTDDQTIADLYIKGRNLSINLDL